MRAVWNQIKFQKDLYLCGGLIMLGMYVFGMIIHDIIMAVDDEVTSVFYMGSMMAMIGLFMMMLFFTGIHLVTVFNYAVSMGQLRKQVVPAYMLATFSTFLALGIGLKLLHALEGFCLGLKFRGLPKEDIVGPALEWKFLLVYGLVGTAITVLFGATLIKFGKAAYWVWWILLMLVCIGGPRLLAHQESFDPDGAVMNFLLRVTEFVITHAQIVAVVSVAGVTVVFLTAAYLLLRKQQVNL